MSDPVIQIMSLAGCTEEVARLAFEAHRDTVLAVDSLICVPETKSSRYIPKKPEINRMMSAEQKERCDRGRQVCDTINACRKSAYHSSIQQADSVSVVPLEQTLEVPEVHAESPKTN